MKFSVAVVRPPAENFADGLTTANLGSPDHALALIQHKEYCTALESCGLQVVRLEPDPRHPDSTFVEDTAVVLPSMVVLTRPGAPSRLGEVAGMVDTAISFRKNQVHILEPATLDGGDVCEAGETWFAGISERTNQEGIRQLGKFLGQDNRNLVSVDIRGIPGLLHIKSGISWLGEKRLLVTEHLANHPAFTGFEQIIAVREESYAANCILVNGHLLLPAGYPQTSSILNHLGYKIIHLNMSEFQKMDGGLSCLSLRF